MPLSAMSYRGHPAGNNLISVGERMDMRVRVCVKRAEMICYHCVIVVIVPKRENEETGVEFHSRKTALVSGDIGFVSLCDITAMFASVSELV